MMVQYIDYMRALTFLNIFPTEDLLRRNRQGSWHRGCGQECGGCGLKCGGMGKGSVKVAPYPQKLCVRSVRDLIHTQMPLHHEYRVYHMN